MRAYEILTELFHDPNRILPVTWSWGEEKVTATFNTPKGTPLVLLFEKCVSRRYRLTNTWIVTLESVSGISAKFKETGDEEPRDGLIIYSTVVKCVVDFLTREKPDRLIFSGYTDKQHKLYGMMIKNLGARLENLGYELEHGNVDEFVIKKIS